MRLYPIQEGYSKKGDIARTTTRTLIFPFFLWIGITKGEGMLKKKGSVEVI